ncbi:MAG: hypothetical protein AB7O97_08115 [Planctomycetota bacterium]
MNPIRTAWLAAVTASLAVAQQPVADGLAEVERLGEQFTALQQDLRKQWSGLEQLPADEREAAGDRIYGDYQAKVAALSERLVEIVTEHPAGELGAKAIGAALGMPLNKAGRAIVVEALADHHATGPTIAPLLPRLRYVAGKTVDALLQRVIDENPDRAAKGGACLTLAQRQEEEEPKAELLERCVADFADVMLGEHTVGATAETLLTALRNIKVGKVPPDIVGKDMDGAAFKLSDYRGKVVMLDYWGYW